MTFKSAPRAMRSAHMAKSGVLESHARCSGVSSFLWLCPRSLLAHFLAMAFTSAPLSRSSLATSRLRPATHLCSTCSLNLASVRMEWMWRTCLAFASAPFARKSFSSSGSCIRNGRASSNAVEVEPQPRQSYSLCCALTSALASTSACTAPRHAPRRRPCSPASAPPPSRGDLGLARSTACSGPRVEQLPQVPGGSWMKDALAPEARSSFTRSTSQASAAFISSMFRSASAGSVPRSTASADAGASQGGAILTTPQKETKRGEN
mmetsp:Transcript_33715/g.88323  ORF Transcript_33715/g.88323 Transcript_33715/m.88323 type:complete len:264 (+) Transcript_33715:506-1297(+)